MHFVICSGFGSLGCFVMIKCTKFGQLILRKIIKFVAAICQILRLKCTKFDFAGAYSDPQTLAGFKGPTSNGREGKRKGRGRGRGGSGKEKGKWSEWKGEGAEKRSPCSDFIIILITVNTSHAWRQ